MRTMNRREFLRVTGAAALGAAALPHGARAAASPAAPATGTAPPRRRPNVLYVFSDMQRAYSMGCYGDANARTPVLDAFARQGARLDAAMSNTPVCCPYRACLMSGQYAHHHGMMSNSVDFLPKVKCLGETFRDAGYVTGYSGKWHLEFPRQGTEDRRFGFPPPGTPYGFYQTNRNSKVVTDVALRFIAEKSTGQAPWLLMVSWILPHAPYQAPVGYRGHFANMHLPPNVPPGAAAEYARRNLPEYYGMIESLDVEFGRILKALDAAGVADDTIVVYSSDHGDMVGSHGLEAKRWPYEESARIPFLVRYSRAVPAGTVIADPVGSTDFYPTLAGLAGVEAPSGLDGADFSPLLTGSSSKPPRDYVYLEMAYAYVPWPGWRALRTRQFMYARTKDKPWLLFDLAKDPWEMNNLVEDASRADLVKEMDERLAAVMRQTGDSWDLQAHSGDPSLWLPGGPKQRSQKLGAHWPGKAGAAGDDSPAAPGKGRNARRKGP